MYIIIITFDMTDIKISTSFKTNVHYGKKENNTRMQ